MTPPQLAVTTKTYRHTFARLLATLFLPRTSSSALPLRIWSLAAIISLVVATWISIQPGYLADLWLMRDWFAYWSHGGNPYLVFRDLDYPPNAFLLLWPMQWISDTTLVAMFIPSAIVCSAAATWLMSGWLAERIKIDLLWQDRAVLVAIMLAGSSLRAAMWRGQLAPLAFLLGAAALSLSRRRPWLSAVALAACAFKPHVAIGFAMAILVTEGAPIVIGAAAIAGAMIWWFAWQVSLPVPSVMGDYIANLIHLYDGPERVRGLLSVRWVIEDLLGNYDEGTLFYVITALITGTILIDAALTMRRAGERAIVATALLMWALLFLPHQLYHGWMAAPALWLMMWPESGLISSSRIRLIAVTAFVSAGVLDVPRLIRLVIDVDANWSFTWTSYALSPLRVAIVFAFLLWTIMRRAASSRRLELRSSS